MKQVQAWVEAAEGEFVEGHYYAPDASFFSLKPSGEACPFCFAPLDLIQGSVFGRIVRDMEERNRSGDRTRVVVELLPATHEALKCSDCEMVFTRVA